MTSVKEFTVEREARPSDLGQGSFRFTDAYSVFDWGRMPDPIPEKGASLCTMGAANFETLEANAIPTHYRGVVENEQVLDLAETTDPPREMAISLTQVPELPYDSGTDAYDYEAYHETAGTNYLIPLEIVFRNTIPPGSSLRNRSDPSDHGLSPADDTDANGWPAGTVSLPEPVVEFSTKYEHQDRYLSREEASTVAGRASLNRLEELALAVDHLVTERAEERGFVHEDGKIECLYYEGTIAVADVVGTFDENRFSYDGQQISKQVLRNYYRREHPQWTDAVGEAKRRASKEGFADWHGLCDEDPPALPERVIETAAALYTAGANVYLDESVFDAPPLDEAIEAARTLQDGY
jgi:phosphoribosylaminoimidazole-succinocarboxamide synthase